MSVDPLLPRPAGGERAAALADVLREAAEASLDPRAVLDVVVARCAGILGGSARVREIGPGDPEPRAAPAPGGRRLEVPLRSRGRALALLTLTRGPGEPPYSAADAAFAADVADRVALLYDNARLYRRVLLNATVLDQVDAAVVAVDARLRVTAWNPAAQRLFGWAPREALGRDAPALVSAEPQERFAEARAAVAENGTYSGEWSLRRRDGTTFPGHLRLATARDDRGETVGMVGVFEDLTERERLVARLERQAARQAAIAELGEVALESAGPAPLLDHAVRAARTVLGMDVDAVLEPHEALRAAGETSVLIQGRDGPHGVLVARAGAGARPDAEDRGFLQAVARVLGDALDRWRSEEEIRRRSLHDPLTELPNRALVLDRLAHALERADRRDAPAAHVALLFLDIDHFKSVNDSLGHRAGDDLLCMVAGRLRAAVRPADTVGRFGGDEFIVLCEDVHDERMGLAIAERLASAFAEPFHLAGGEHRVGASIGLVLRTGSEDPEALLRDADAAMYRAKERGRGRVELFDTRMRASAAGRQQTETALRRAIDADELEIHVQPIIALDGGATVAQEALVRWRHPERGLLLPAEFLPVAEESGLVVPLGRRVLEHACREVAAHGRRTHVNLSPRQLQDPALVATVEATLGATGGDAALLAFEIAEDALGERGPERLPTLEALRALGCGLLLDRFGTGSSSLANLAELPIETLKIDRTLVAGLDAGQEPIVDAVIRLARALGLGVVAVGVEHPGQLAALRRLGCELGQGVLLGAPDRPSL